MLFVTHLAIEKQETKELSKIYDHFLLQSRTVL